jgi:predicted metal-dependent peptidase
MHFTYEYMQEIANRLDSYHSVFSQLWSLGIPVMTNSCPTAAVWFDDVGDALHMEINPKFWSGLNHQQQNFIICHECFHVLLSHGSRMAAVSNPDIANVAADVVINELLVNQFGFSRKAVDPENEYCWKDKVLPKNFQGAILETFEWYYNYLDQKMQADNGIGDAGKLVDDHSKLTAADASRIVRRAIDKMSDEEFKKLQEKIKDELNAQAGTDAGGVVAVMDSGPVRPKPKWETIVKSRLKKFNTDVDVESWAHTSRRMSAMHRSVILPVEISDEGPAPSRRQIYLFLDTSGSCQSLAPRFWKLAKSIPKDKFEIHPFCFDTKVYDISFKDKKLYGFGGTSFSILEGRIQKELTAKKINRYPDAIFVVTDGWGTKLAPEVPENWHILLTPHGERKCFPSTVHFYDLNEFE